MEHRSRFAFSVLHESLVDAILEPLSVAEPDPQISEAAARALHTQGLRRLARFIDGRYAGLPNLAVVIKDLANPDGPFTVFVDPRLVISAAQRLPADAPAATGPVLGLVAMALIEGAARRHRPDLDFPQWHLNSIEAVLLPAAELFVKAGALSGAATAARLLREYMLADPYQRISSHGQRLLARCRSIEQTQALHLQGCCQEAAWSLSEILDQEAVLVAALFFAVGDQVRSAAIVREGHRPSISVLIRLVETSVKLIQQDPLLQAVWLIVLGSTDITVHSDLRRLIRRISPETNGAFKGVDAGVANTHGVSLSGAYARAVIHCVTGQLGSESQREGWWKSLLDGTLLGATLVYTDYPSGYLRLIELLTLATAPERPLPITDGPYYMATGEPQLAWDLRDMASAALTSDMWTGGRRQTGSSLAYDSAFLLEPRRFDESTEERLDRLEEHRFAGLAYWLTVIPPYAPPPSDTAQEEVVAADEALMREYRFLAFVAALQDAPFYLRTYGEPYFKKTLHVSPIAVRDQVSVCQKARQRWFAKAREVYPGYAAARIPRPTTLQGVILRLVLLDNLG
ncbi:hypothetical protein ACFV6F_35815 [Kitasatospora phosalacinea]|uniref:hypothetical protein n=1 Tax=Kitasatospora phosalacinea TaxID=2065 RepID=UPI00365FBC85